MISNEVLFNKDAAVVTAAIPRKAVEPAVVEALVYQSTLLQHCAELAKVSLLGGFEGLGKVIGAAYRWLEDCVVDPRQQRHLAEMAARPATVVD